MNWYVLNTLSQKTNKIVSNLNGKCGIEAFIPQYEVCQRKTKEVIIKPMFNNYVFVKTMLSQGEFNDLLLKMRESNNGLIKQLKNEEVSALSDAEIDFFSQVLDKNHIIKVSQGYQLDGVTYISDGPLKLYEKHIVKVDKHNQCAYLDLVFFNRRILMGINI